MMQGEGLTCLGRGEQNKVWHNPQVKADMEELLAVRAEVNGLLEQARNDKCVLSRLLPRLSLQPALTASGEQAHRQLERGGRRGDQAEPNPPRQPCVSLCRSTDHA